MINHGIFHKFFRRKKYDIFHKKYNIDWVNFCDSLLPGAWAAPPPQQLDWTRQPLTICQLKYFSTVLFTFCCSRCFIIIQSWSASTWVTHRVDGVRWTTACQSTRHMLTPAVARPHCSRRQESHTRPPPFLHCPYLSTCHHCSASIKAKAAESGQNGILRV